MRPAVGGAARRLVAVEHGLGFGRDRSLVVGVHGQLFATRVDQCDPIEKGYSIRSKDSAHNSWSACMASCWRDAEVIRAIVLEDGLCLLHGPWVAGGPAAAPQAKALEAACMASCLRDTARPLVQALNGSEETHEERR